MAEALVKASKPDEVVAYFCTNCGTVYSDKNGTGKDDAERCAVKHMDKDPSKHCTEWACEECGKPAFSAYQWYCHDCLGKRRLKQEHAKLAKAEKVVKAEDYPSDQGIVYDGEYHHCVEDFLEHCLDHDVEVPDRVWATSPSTFSLNAEEILENAWENWSEGCDDASMNEINGEDEFKAAVEAFNQKQTFRIFWECDTAVDMTGYQGSESDDEDEDDDEL